MARIVSNRDRGVCALCGLDTRALKLSVGRMRYRYGSDEDWNARFAEAFRHGYTERDRWRARLWDVDHIVPVVEGGGACGLDNLRTLCCPCHRRVTADLARKRAEKRKSESSP